MSEPRDDADERAGSIAPPSESLIHDDDELASALAAQMLRYAPTGAIKIVAPVEPAISDSTESTSERSFATDLTPTPPREFAAVSSEPEPEIQPELQRGFETETESVPPAGEAESDEAVTPGSESSDTVAIDLTELIREEQGTDFSAFAAAAGIPVPAEPESQDTGAESREAADGVDSPVVVHEVAPWASITPSASPAGPTSVETDAAPAPAPATAAEPLTPDSVEGETALEKALLLESALAEVAVDTAMYADWEQSLRSMSEAASASPVNPEPEVSLTQPDAQDRAASTQGGEPAPETGDSEAGDDESAPGPRRQTFTSPVTTSPADVVDEGAGIEAETTATRDADEDRPELDSATAGGVAPVVSELPPREPVAGELALLEPGEVDDASSELADDVGDPSPATSVVDLETLPAATIPEDEFVAVPVARTGSNGGPDASDAEVVEAEVVDDEIAEQPSPSSTPSLVASTDEMPAEVVEESGSVEDADAEDAAREVPTTTGPVIGLLAATPPRWAGGIDGVPAMARPRVPGSPLASGVPTPSDEADDHPLAPGPRRTPAPAERPEPDTVDEVGPSPDSAPVPSPAPASSNDLITDTGPLTLGRGAQGPRIDTGSVPIITGGMQLDVDLDDDIDDVATPFEALLDGDDASPVAPAEPGTHTGPIVPISTAALVAGPAPVPGAAPSTREVSTDTGRLSYALPADGVAGPAGFGRHFASWPGATSSVLVLALGALLVSGGLSPVQSVLAAVLGAVVAALPIALTTIGAARRRTSGAALSRSSFGTTGAAIPNSVLVIARVVVLAGLLWAFVIATRSVVFESGYDLFIDPALAAWIGAGIVAVGAAILAATGGRALARAQWILSLLAVLSVVSLIVGSVGLVDFSTIGGAAPAQPIAVFAGVMTVLALIVAVWGGVGADVLTTRAESRSGLGAGLGTTLGTILPLIVLIVWGVLLAGGDPTRTALLSTDPVAAMAQGLPSWYPVPLLLALLAPALGASALLARSGGVALASVVPGAPRFAATSAVAFVGICVGVVLVLLVPASNALVLDAAPLVAVPVLAWSGIAGAEALLRRDDDGLSAFIGGDEAPAFRWGPVIAFVVISGLGWGLLVPSASTGGVGGWLWNLLGMTDSAVALSGLGVLVPLVLGSVVGIVSALGASRGRDDRPARTAPSDLLTAPRDTASEAAR